MINANRALQVTPEAEKKIKLYTLDTGYPEHLLRHIQLALVISKKHHRKNLEIVLQPKSLLRPSWIRWRIKNALHTFLKGTRTHGSPIGFVDDLRKNDTVLVTASGVEVRITRDKKRTKDRVKSILTALIWCSNAFLAGCGRKTNRLWFLNIEYESIPVGRFASATALRREERCGGQLKRSRTKFFWLWDAVAVANFFWLRNFENDETCYFSVEDEAYVGGLYEHLHFQRGHRIISQNSPRHLFELVGSQEQLNSQRTVKRGDEHFLPEDMRRIHNYMEKRFKSPKEVLPYMEVGKNDFSANEDFGTEVEDYSESSISGVTAVVFLHAFSDAQYIFGLDGFEDISDWTKFTIRHLVKNCNVEKVLIKPHPNIDLEYYRADRVAMMGLRNEFTSSKITWLPANTNLCQLSRTPGIVGITHHGSVAEELVYLNVPVISSTSSPWADEFKFCHTWKNVNEYNDLLTTISTTARETKKYQEKYARELFSYILQARLDKIRTQDIFENLYTSGLVSEILPRGERQKSIRKIVENHKGNDLSNLVTDNSRASQV